MFWKFTGETKTKIKIHSLKSKHHKVMMKQQVNFETLHISNYLPTMLQYIFNHSLYTGIFHDHPIIKPLYRRRQNSCKKLQTFLMLNCFLSYIYHQPYSTLHYSYTMPNEMSVNLWAPCVLYIGQAFYYSPENAFYVFNQQIYCII